MVGGPGEPALRHDAMPPHTARRARAGEPSSVLRLEEVEVQPPREGQIQLRFLQARCAA